MKLTISPADTFRPQRWTARGALRQVRGWSIISNLTPSIAERQREAVLQVLRRQKLEAVMECVGLPSLGQGTCVVLAAEFEQVLAGFASLGQIGKPAEQVGQEAAQALVEFVATDAAVEEHLADQAVLFLALAPGPSEFTTSKITRHLLTNLWTIEQFLPIRATVEGTEGHPGRVMIRPSTGGEPLARGR